MTDRRKAETILQAQIVAMYEGLGWWVLRTGASSPDHRVRTVEPGTPDLLVLHPVYLWVEVKVPGGSISDTQLKWHAKAIRLGVPVVTVDNFKDAMRVVQERRT